MRTACDVMNEAKRKYSRPDSLTKDEVDNLAEDLFCLLEEMHGMAESMDDKLREYNDFVKGILKDGSSIIGAERKG